jgi:hypothetical protein
MRRVFASDIFNAVYAVPWLMLLGYGLYCRGPGLIYHSPGIVATCVLIPLGHLLGGWWAHGKRIREMVHWPRGTPTCTRCGYDLAGNRSGTCPECGHNRFQDLTRWR